MVSFTCSCFVERPVEIFCIAYLEFIFERLRHKNIDGSLQIMYTIHGVISFLAPLLFCCTLVDLDTFSGEKDIPEIALTHLDGHKGSKPVRVGNGAADHIQLVSVACLHALAFN